MHIQMETFDNIVHNGMSQMIAKGYDDQSLNAFAGLASFERKFAIGFSDALVLFDRHNEHSLPFSIPLMGFFRGDKDVVRFNFSFFLDEETHKPIFNSVRASMGDVMTNHVMGNSIQEFPSAESIYNELSEQRIFKHQNDPPFESRVAAMEFKDRYKIGMLANQEVDLLYEKNYLSNHAKGSSNRNVFYGQMRDELLSHKMDHTREQRAVFVLHTGRAGQDDRGIMSTRLAFQFDCSYHSLRIIGVDARLGAERAVVFPKNTDMLPEFEELYWHLAYRKGINDARQIYRQLATKRQQGLTSATHRFKNNR